MLPLFVATVIGPVPKALLASASMLWELTVVPPVYVPVEWKCTIQGGTWNVCVLVILVAMATFPLPSFSAAYRS